MTPDARQLGRFKSPQGHARRAGMTLVELLVALGVMMLLMMIFSQVLSSAQRVAVKSNSMVQGNSAAIAIAQLLRDDVASLDPNGFLVITPDPNNTGSDCLIFSAASMYTSQTDPNRKTNAAMISYGWDANHCTLWRHCRPLLDILPGSRPTPDPNMDDWDPNGLGDYMALTSVPGPPAAPGSLEAVVACPPPATAEWRELDNRCVAFEVYWWDSTSTPKKWQTTVKTVKRTTPVPEVLRITFTLCLSEPELALVRAGIKAPKDAKETIDYEVICPIRP